MIKVIDDTMECYIEGFCWGTLIFGIIIIITVSKLLLFFE